MAPKLSILIADGDQAVRESLQDYFLSFGHEVAAVADGYRAVKSAGEMKFDIAFIASQMPGLPPFEAAREMKRMQSQMRILLMIEELDESTKDEIERNGYDVISKPFSLKDIKEIILTL